MPENDRFFSVNIREYLALGNDEEAGEERDYTIRPRITRA